MFCGPDTRHRDAWGGAMGTARGTASAETAVRRCRDAEAAGAPATRFSTPEPVPPARSLVRSASRSDWRSTRFGADRSEVDSVEDADGPTRGRPRSPRCVVFASSPDAPEPGGCAGEPIAANRSRNGCRSGRLPPSMPRMYSTSVGFVTSQRVRMLSLDASSSRMRLPNRTTATRNPRATRNVPRSSSTVPGTSDERRMANRRTPHNPSNTATALPAQSSGRASPPNESGPPPESGSAANAAPAGGTPDGACSAGEDSGLTATSPTIA